MKICPRYYYIFTGQLHCTLFRKIPLQIVRLASSRVDAGQEYEDNNLREALIWRQVSFQSLA